MSSKPFYMSKTLWGVIILLPVIAQAIFNADVPLEMRTDLFDAISATVGAVLVIYGRLTARTDLSIR